MDENIFWEIIESAKIDSLHDADKQALIIIEQLSKMTNAEIIAFDRIFTKLLEQANQEYLWAAAIIIGCWCADDCFKDFRAWLIGQGKEVYQKALDNPETLIHVVVLIDNEDVIIENEDLNYAAEKAYEKKTGELLPKPIIYDAFTPPKRDNKDFTEWLKTYPLLVEKYWSKCDDF